MAQQEDLMSKEHEDTSLKVDNNRTEAKDDTEGRLVDWLTNSPEGPVASAGQFDVVMLWTFDWLSWLTASKRGI